MTDFARKVLTGLPAPTTGGTANNYVISQLFSNDTNKAGGKVDVVVTPAAVALRPRRLARRRHLRQPVDPAAVGRRRQRHDLRREHAGGVRRHLHAAPARRCSKFRFGWSETTAGKNPAALGQPSAFDEYGITGLPDDPRVAGGLPSQLITGYSDLGRQATNPQWQYPTVFNPKINYSWLNGRALAQGRLRVPARAHRGAGRQPALRPRPVRRPVHPAGRRRGRQQPLQPGRLHVRPALDLRAQQHPGRQPRSRTCTSATCRTTGASTIG